jgi:hypothetical protein
MERWILTINFLECLDFPQKRLSSKSKHNLQEIKVQKKPWSHQCSTVELLPTFTPFRTTNTMRAQNIENRPGKLKACSSLKITTNSQLRNALENLWIKIRRLGSIKIYKCFRVDSAFKIITIKGHKTVHSLKLFLTKIHAHTALIKMLI